MKKILVILFAITIKAAAQEATPYYVASDLTGENLFSTNIEGPNVDKDGNLFVVNFQKDGTIGKVGSDGSVELFVTLPYGSIANAIMFNEEWDMYLADFKGHNVLKVNTKTRKVSVYCHNGGFNQPNDLTINKK